MSHYTKIQTQLTSAIHLIKALADLGFSDVEHYNDPANLEGYEGKLRRETAEVIIRKCHVGHLSNDIGFKRLAGGFFSAVISEFDSTKYDDIWLNKLTQRYSYHVTRDALEQKGFDLIEEEQKGSEIRLTLRRMT